ELLSVFFCAYAQALERLAMFETFEHTADLGLRVTAPQLDTLFAEAGRGLFLVIAGNLDAVRTVESIHIQLTATRPDELLFDCLIYASEELIDTIRGDPAPEQVANVAFLPGIQVASLAMPDIHWGYGFCIGGVCATDPAEGGVISPGGVGYDINCGVRLVRS